MSEALFLVNPRRKRRKSRRKGRMPAGLARYWAARRGGKKRRKARAVMTNPRRRRRRARARAVNPRRRRKSRSVVVYTRKRRRNPRRKSYRRHRHRARSRNPFSTGSIKSALMPALFGAGGAIVTNIAFGYGSSYLPASLQTGWGAFAVQAAVAIGIGFLAGKFMGRSDGQAVAVGGLTVVAVTALTPVLSSAVPSLPGLSGLRGLADYQPYRRPGVGAYMRQKGVGRLGFYSPAAVVQQSGRALGPKPAMRGMGAYMARSVPGMAGFGDLSGGSGFNGLNDGM